MNSSGKQQLILFGLFSKRLPTVNYYYFYGLRFMQNLSKNTIIGVIGAGTMGAGIAQVAASNGHQVVLCETNAKVIEKAKSNIAGTYQKLVEKGKVSASDASEIQKRIHYAMSIETVKDCGLIIEAIIEDLSVKKALFSDLEEIVSSDCILATNTSSLSVTSIAAACKKSARVIGLHFFNPAPLMPLVEIIPSVQTDAALAGALRELMLAWKKTPVIARDTPGFIVNRLARSYYGESIRIYEESWEGVERNENGLQTIDQALKSAGFKMGPFELMDMIGNDINYTVTETVWKQMFHDSRYKPSLTQKRLFEAGRFGRKSGIGYYNYSEGASNGVASVDPTLQEKIFSRVIAMLINEAVDAFYLGIATREDLDQAMMKGVNYPKGLLQWCDEIGAQKILSTLESLYADYLEERYRPSVLLRKMASSGKKFYN